MRILIEQGKLKEGIAEGEKLIAAFPAKNGMRWLSQKFFPKKDIAMKLSSRWKFYS
jgi:hypothetical protein